MSHKRETIEGFYRQNGKEYEYTLEAVIRDNSGRNDTIDVIWQDDEPADADTAEEAILDKYFNKQFMSVAGYSKINKAVDALYSALTCVWEDNGNIMAEAVRDYVAGTLAEIAGITIPEVEAEVEKRRV